MSNGELILYQADDGGPAVQLRAEGGTVWLSQAEMAELFRTSPQNVTQHIRSIYGDGEQSEGATCKEFLQVRLEGGRAIKRTIRLYSLDVILAVGYRVRGDRGTRFRQWATTRLRDYLVKGFVIDDARLKGAERFDYFDELLEKIREIRASEKRFYQKIKDVYTTSVDYDGGSERAQMFFATVQNKMPHAVTGGSISA
ncbi:MAG: RhuM family protein [Caulobacter sp.]